MAKVSELLRYLNNNHVEYQVHSHMPAFSAHDVAMATHVPDRDMAKTLVVQAGKQKWLAVLRADYRIDQRLLRRALETHSIHFVSEEELEMLFPNCEVGAMPPFGNLYGLPVIADKSLAEDEEIVFNACTYSESVRMRFEDFERLVKPMVLGFAVPDNVRESQLQKEG
ncbi:MAG: YbaK/EbsC family protein [Bacteroidota bacterium]